MTILNGRQPIRVDSIEADKCATRGLHVNAVRRPNFIKSGKGKTVPNPEGGRLVYCDGCYDRSTVLTVQLPQQLPHSA